MNFTYKTCLSTKSVSVAMVPVVDHNSTSKECRRRMGAAYALKLHGDSFSGEEKLNSLRRKLDQDDEKDNQEKGSKQRKTKRLLK